MLTRRIPLLLSLALAASGAAYAQDAGEAEDDAGPPTDGGPAEPGDEECEPRCEGDQLLFCDDGVLVALECEELGGRCGLLSNEWGFDCLVPAGSPCEPGYALGLSRCEGAAQTALCCVENECAPPPEGTGSCRVFVPPPPSRPAIAGAAAGVIDSAGCLGCPGGIPDPTAPPQQPGGGGFPFLALLLGLRALKARRRQ